MAAELITLDSPDHGPAVRMDGFRLSERRPKYLHLTQSLGYREDAGETAVIMRALDYVASRATEVMYAELRALQYFPMIGEVPLGAKTFTFAVLDVTGRAERVTGSGKALPRAGITLSENTSSIASYGAEYGWTTEELRAFSYANGNGRGPAISLDTRRGDQAMIMVARKIDDVCAFGDPDDALRIRGVLNNANIDVQQVGFNWLLAGTTFDQMLDDMITIANRVVIQSKDVWKPDTILLPVAHLLATQRKLNSLGTRSVLEAFNMAMKAAKRDVTVDSWPLLETADAPRTGPRAIAYVRDAEKIGCICPALWIAQPPQARGLEWTIPGEGICGGAAVRIPASAVYYELTP